MTWRLGIPGKSSLRLVPRYMEFARGPTFLKLYGELPPRLGCNPKRSNNSSPDRDIPQFTIPFYLYTHCTAGRCCPYCASWPAELCYTSGLAIWRYTGWVLPAQLPSGHRWCHTKVPAGWPSESTQYPGLLRVLEPSQRGAPLRVPLASLCGGSCNPGCPWRQSHTCTR